MTGKFITFEGLDGAGKSTQLVALSRFLEARGIRHCVTREPGGTPIGEKLRALVLDAEQHLHPETELLLMFAARREHLERVIVPALKTGTWVLCDRYTDASFAYQGGGSGVPWDRIEALENWVQRGVVPDLTLYFDVSAEVGRARSGSVRVPDRYEREQQSFHERVRAAYLRRSCEAKGRIRTVDADRAAEAVQRDVEVLVSGLIGATAAAGNDR